MKWLEVEIHAEEFSDETKYIWIGGNPVPFITASGRRVYRATCDGPTNTDSALNADDGKTKIAEPGESFSADRVAALVSERRVDRINGSPRHFEITVDFKDPTGGEILDDLLARPARINYESTNITGEYWLDSDFAPDHPIGKPVTSSAGEPFDQLPTRFIAGHAFAIEKYVDAQTKGYLLSIEHTNNTGAFIIDNFMHGDNTLLLDSLAFEEVAGIYKATIRITYCGLGWKDQILNAGFSQINEDGDLADCTQLDKNGDEVPVARPAPLDAATGNQLVPGDTVQFLNFFPYPYGNWDALKAVLR
jgi:hypothetical protein